MYSSLSLARCKFSLPLVQLSTRGRNALFLSSMCGSQSNMNIFFIFLGKVSTLLRHRNTAFFRTTELYPSALPVVNWTLFLSILDAFGPRCFSILWKWSRSSGRTRVRCDWYFRDECSGTKGPCPTWDSPPQDLIAGKVSSVEDNYRFVLLPKLLTSFSL